MQDNDKSSRVKYSALLNVGIIFGNVDSDCVEKERSEFYQTVLRHVPKSEIEEFIKENVK